jgi:hypothetical protein
MLEAILKLATGDPDFEFQVMSTPYPLLDGLKKESFTHSTKFKTKTQPNFLSMIKSWTDIGLDLTAIFTFALVILAASIVAQVARERLDLTKNDRVLSGLHKLNYWLVRYAWDLIKFIPVCIAI